jgi:hypothetical protein
MMGQTPPPTAALPRFLVIGAMKAGTTTLYQDLRATASVFVPIKELQNLTGDAATTDRGRARYADLFAAARPDQIAGEVSTWYAMLPDWPGVAERAGSILGEDFRVIYLVRNPVDRVVSHHHHELARSLTDVSSIDAAVRDVPRLLSYTRYHSQLTPWTEVVGTENVRVVSFEDYVADRAAGLRSILDFIGAAGSEVPANLDTIHNATDGTVVSRGATRRVIGTSLYRRTIHPWVPSHVRELGRKLFLASPPPRPLPPSPATVALILEELAPDLELFQRLYPDVVASWNLEQTRQRYERAYQASHSERD